MKRNLKLSLYLLPVLAGAALFYSTERATNSGANPSTIHFVPVQLQILALPSQSPDPSEPGSFILTFHSPNGRWFYFVPRNKHLTRDQLEELNTLPAGEWVPERFSPPRELIVAKRIGALNLDAQQNPVSYPGVDVR